MCTCDGGPCSCPFIHLYRSKKYETNLSTLRPRPSHPISIEVVSYYKHSITFEIDICTLQGNVKSLVSKEMNEVSTDNIETTPNEVYGLRTDGIEITPNEVYGVSTDDIETTPNEVYGLRTDGIETTPNEVYGVRQQTGSKKPFFM